MGRVATVKRIDSPRGDEAALKRYEVWDQRFPLKEGKVWVANLVFVGEIEARDIDHALRVAKSKARFPVVYNWEDFNVALREERREKARELAEAQAEV